MMSLDPLRTNFLNHARDVAPQAKTRRRIRRGYAKDDLFAIAEIGYHYLNNGGGRFARMIFEGLCAVAPDEVYFALALGLAADHTGDLAAARHAYARAGKLDPTDGRPDVNIAELCIQTGDHRRAKAYLKRALDKLRQRPDAALERKARALFVHLQQEGTNR